MQYIESDTLTARVLPKFDGAEARRKLAEAIEQQSEEIKQAMEESPVDYEQARAGMLADLEQAMEASRGDLERQAQEDRKAVARSIRGLGLSPELEQSLLQAVDPARQIRQAVDAQLRDFERQQKEVLPDALKRSQEFVHAFGESIVRLREDSVAPELDKERVAPFLSRIETLYREN